METKVFCIYILLGILFDISISAEKSKTCTVQEEKASVQSKIQGRGCPITFFSKPESMFKG